MLGLNSLCHAESLFEALSRAYSENLDINHQRAAVRVRDEDVPKAAASSRPKVGITANVGAQSTHVRSGGIDPQTGGRVFGNSNYFGQPRGANLTVSQPLFDGFRTQNSIRQAESNVFAARATLRATEQSVFLKAATAYMGVLRDTAILRLRNNNISVLKEQLRETRARYNLGDATITDLSQAEAGVAQAHSDFYVAEANLKVSAASYRQVIGVEPGRLEPPPSVKKLLPRSIEEALEIALIEHPNIHAYRYQEDAAALSVKVAEGALLPTLSLNAQIIQQFDYLTGQPGTNVFYAQGALQLNAPLYQGGGEFASIRQAKEQLGQARLATDLQRAAIRKEVVSSYARLKASITTIRAGHEVIKAAEAALRGVRIESLAAQRTLLDVLSAQQALLDARVKLVGYQHDYVVGCFTALSAVGRLDAQILNLEVTPYNAAVHFDQVKESWLGVSTPGGL
ncbi:TolC family outer membrane protein [Methylosinus sp. PW1]|uniref:TolC family outer membrane protein n=1 Tax=Methylosinus sp. PW1 TaxID=107636 RepID=UPI00068ED0FF|nr:TolC family outer membrane protein [Methylosinus sp. PW1]